MLSKDHTCDSEVSIHLHSIQKTLKYDRDPQQGHRHIEPGIPWRPGEMTSTCCGAPLGLDRLSCQHVLAACGLPGAACACACADLFTCEEEFGDGFVERGSSRAHAQSSGSRLSAGAAVGVHLV